MAEQHDPLCLFGWTLITNAKEKECSDLLRWCVKDLLVVHPEFPILGFIWFWSQRNLISERDEEGTLKLSVDQRELYAEAKELILAGKEAG